MAHFVIAHIVVHTWSWLVWMTGKLPPHVWTEAGWSLDRVQRGPGPPTRPALSFPDWSLLITTISTPKHYRESWLNLKHISTSLQLITIMNKHCYYPITTNKPLWNALIASSCFNQLALIESDCLWLVGLLCLIAATFVVLNVTVFC